MQELLKKFWAGDFRALAKVISILENEDSGHEALMRQICAKTGRAYILGVTGSPGAGKSSLVDQLTTLLRKAGNTVGIIAVDPTSPFSSGALLGDRIRMQEHTLDQGVFMRSMATRGSLGGLAYATKEAVRAVNAFGFDWVIVETVGVGQTEMNILYVADTVVVVLTPGAGDSIQAMKSGIMEIADVFAVNKSDLPGADKVASEVEAMLQLKLKAPSWHPPVVKTSTVTPAGLEDFLTAIQEHRNYLIENGLFQTRREERLKAGTLEILDRMWQTLIREEIITSKEVSGILELAARQQMDQYTAAASVFKHIFAGAQASCSWVEEILQKI